MNLELGLGLTQFIPPILYLVSVVVVLITLFKRIEIGVYFLVFFLPIPNILEYTEKYPLGKDTTDILLIVLIIKWIIDTRKSQEKFVASTPFNLPLLLLILWTLVEFWHGANYLGQEIVLDLNEPRLKALKNFLFVPLIYLIIVNNIKHPTQIKVVVGIMIFAILLLDRNSYNIMQNQDLSNYSDNLKVIGKASALSGNSLAVFFAQYSIVLVALVWCLRHVWLKIALSVPALLSYYCTLFLFSRSGYLGLAIGLIYWGIVKSRILLIGIIISFISYQTILPNAVKQRIEMTRTEDGFDNTTQQRFAMWTLATDIISGNPILGAGFNFTQAYNIQIEDQGHIWHSFHNSFVQQAVETGLIGLGLYLWIFVLAMRQGWRLYQRSDDDFEKGLGLGLVGCVLACMAGNIGGSYWNMLNVMGFFWVLAALVNRCLLNYQPVETA